jgi:beta-glucanase (GH16 family)
MWKRSWVVFFIFILSSCNAYTAESTPPPTAINTFAVTPPPISTQIPAPTALPSLTAEWDRPGWTLVWQDEFDGKELNPQNWNYDLGGNGWGNREAQAFTNRPENVRVQDGMLVIEARQESEPIAGRNYSSARVKTEGLHDWKYGRIEARLKLPQGQGIWPAFWMMGEDYEQKGWPACGEADIMEFIGSEPDLIHATMHGPGYSGSSGIGTSLATSAESLKNDFHVYAIEWDENEIRWYFDGQQYFKRTPQEVPGEWVFNHPFFILLSLSVGGNWPGYPDSTTVFPQYLFVDYVRVYQRP